MKRFFLPITFLSLLIAASALAENPAVIPVPRPATATNWISRHEGFVALAKQGGVDLLLLVDQTGEPYR